MVAKEVILHLERRTMDKDYQTKMEFVVRTHDDKGLYKDFYQFGHEILDDDTVQRIFVCIDNALQKEESNVR